MLVYTLKQILPRRVWEWLKRARQRILGRRAYMNPSYSIEGEDRIVRALLWQKHDKGFYVDVGAHHPFRFSNTYLFYTQGWSGINIDATPGSMKAFNKYRPRDINLEVGVGRGRKTGGGGESCKDSALGEQCGSVANFVKGTTAKVANLPQSLQSSHSPTATPRIPEEEKQAKSKNKTGLESNFLDSSSPSSRAAQSGVAIHKKVDSTSEAQNLKMPAKDSRIFDKNAQNVFSQNATRRQDLGDKNGALQGESRAHTWAYVTADSPQQSPFLAPKPTPKPIKAQSSSDKPTPRYMEYYMFNEPAWNTFDPQVAQNSLGKIQRIVKVPLLTLGEVLHTYVPKGVEIDFLSIDCEGFDLAVLESNDWDSFVPHIIIVEILTNIYGELDMVALQDNEIARFLFSKGYALVAKAHNSVIFQHKDRR